MTLVYFMICNSFKDVLHRYELDFVSNFDGKVNANLYRRKKKGDFEKSPGGISSHINMPTT